VPKGATHTERVVSLHSLLDSDFYREGARVTPAPRRRIQRRAKRRLTPASWLVPVTPNVLRREIVIQREWQRIDPKYLDQEEQRTWATMAGRAIRFEERTDFAKKLAEGGSKPALEQFLSICAAENPNRRLRLMALMDRVSMPIESPDFDDLVTLVTQSPPWEKDRLAGIRILLRAIAERKPNAPDQTLGRWTWRLARAARKALDRKASGEMPEAKRLLGALANSRGHRHEENAARLVNVALEQPLAVGAALLASAEGYTPRANDLLQKARERLGTIEEMAAALADDLPAPKLQSKSRRRRKKKKGAPGAEGSSTGTATTAGEGAAPGEGEAAADGAAPAKPRRKRRRRRSGGGAAQTPSTEGETATTNGAAAPAEAPATEAPAPVADAEAGAAAERPADAEPKAAPRRRAPRRKPAAAESEAAGDGAPVGVTEPE
jgi:hypothetical protein